MIKVVLFDLGGVVFRDIFSGGAADFAKAINMPEEQVLEAYRATDVPEWPEGKISDTERMTLLVDRLGLSRDMVQHCVQSFNLVFQPIPETVQLIGELHRVNRYKLGVLSDQHPGAVQYLHQQYDEVMQLFEPSLIFVSSEVGLAKHEPDRQFFHYAVTHSSVAAKDILFVDDAAANITHAAEVGMMTFFFDRKSLTISNLIADLRTRLL